jgi:hypothetical protein
VDVTLTSEQRGHSAAVVAAAEPRTAVPAPGDPHRIGEFRLRGRLFEQGESVVYLGEAASGSLALVSTYSVDWPEDDERRPAFARRVHAASEPHLATTSIIVGGGAEVGDPWIAQRFLTGPTLEELVASNGPLPVEVCRGLAISLLATIDEFATRGLVAGPITPSRVIITPSGPRLMVAGLPVGHGRQPDFTAPEVLEGRVLGTPSDVYGMATTVQFALGGGSAGPAGGGFSGVGGDLAGVIESAMAVDEAQRPTVAQALAALETGASVSDLPVLQMERSSALRSEPLVLRTTGALPSIERTDSRGFGERAKRLAPLLLLVALLGVAAVSAWQLLSGDDDTSVLGIEQTTSTSADSSTTAGLDIGDLGVDPQDRPVTTQATSTSAVVVEAPGPTLPGDITVATVPATVPTVSTEAPTTAAPTTAATTEAPPDTDAPVVVPEPNVRVADVGITDARFEIESGICVTYIARLRQGGEAVDASPVCQLRHAVLVEGLDPDTAYTLRVEAESNAGVDVVKTIGFRTDEEPPPPAPDAELRAGTTGPFRVQLIVESTPCVSVLLSYEGPTSGGANAAACRTSHQFAIGGLGDPLRPDAIYQVTALVETEAGATDVLTTTVRTAPAPIPPPEIDTVAFDVTHNTATVRVTADQCGFVDLFFFGEIDTEIVTPRQQCRSEVEVVVDPEVDLDPDTTYDLTVVFTSEEGDTDEREVRFRTDPEPVRAELNRLRARDIGITEARITFETTECARHRIVYEDPDGTERVADGTGEPCVTDHSVLLGEVTAALEPDSRYDITVEVFDEFGRADTDTLRFTTEELPRLRISDLEVNVRSRTRADVVFATSVCTTARYFLQERGSREVLEFAHDLPCDEFHGVRLGVVTPNLERDTRYDLLIVVTDEFGRTSEETDTFITDD